MKDNVLVDTSIWIEFFNKDHSVTGDMLEQILLEGRALTTGIVLTELLRGARVEREFEAIKETLTALSFAEPSLATWIEAGRISFSLRRKGITIPTTDLIIGSLALENQWSVFTLDPHFQKIRNLKILETEKPKRK
ncbi:MAG: PIN domain-containing protein [Deltaproteobacteria bacterium]|nr:PIN domain-containing protein [Deltaproteobacteria bacterium]